MLSRIIPDFLDEYEKLLGDMPESMVRKTKNLASISKNSLDADQEKTLIAKTLLEDIDQMKGLKRLRASFDAVLLSMMGE